MHLNEDWSAFLRALLSAKVKFLLIGGHALAVHAEPRFTEDLDVFVEPTPRNAKRVVVALVDFGFGSVAPPAATFSKKDQVVMLGRKPRRIDILTGISGVDFLTAWKGRVVVGFGGMNVPVIGRAALIANKKASGRPKDRVDVLSLKKYGNSR